MAKLDFHPGLHPDAPRAPRFGPSIVGPIPAFLKDPQGLLLRGFRRHGPVFRMRLGSRDFTLLAGPDSSRWVTRHERDYLSVRGTWDSIARLTGADNNAIMANNDGSQHTELRSAFRRSMSRRAAEHQVPEAIEIAQRQLRRADWRGVEAVRTCKQLIFEQLGTTMTGHAPLDLMQDADIVLHAIVQTARFPLLQRFPVPRAVRRALSRVRVLTDLLRAEAEEGGGRTFVLEILEGLERGVYQEADLPALLMTPFVAGLDTLALTLSFALYRFARHPEYQTAAAEEADALFALEGGATSAGLKNCLTLHHAILESMRMHPISPGQLRSLKKPCMLGGYQLRAGDHVMIPHGLTHLLSECFPDPDRFDPSRFERGEHKQPGVFTPYGLGPHICVGAAVADLLLRANCAAILHDYRVELKHPERPLRVSFASIAQPVGLEFRLTPRRTISTAA